MFKTGLIGLLLVGVLAVGSQLPQLWGLAVRTAHTDRVHYSGHLLAGRILSLFPSTADLAETQYAKGLYHARTPAQVALLTTKRPIGTRARLADARLLATQGVREVRRGESIAVAAVIRSPTGSGATLHTTLSVWPCAVNGRRGRAPR